MGGVGWWEVCLQRRVRKLMNRGAVAVKLKYGVGWQEQAGEAVALDLARVCPLVARFCMVLKP